MRQRVCPILSLLLPLLHKHDSVKRPFNATLPFSVKHAHFCETRPEKWPWRYHLHFWWNSFLKKFTGYTDLMSETSFRRWLIIQSKLHISGTGMSSNTVKKSLGARPRNGCYSKFIPPTVKDRDNEVSTCSDFNSFPVYLAITSCFTFYSYSTIYLIYPLFLSVTQSSHNCRKFSQFRTYFRSFESCH